MKKATPSETILFFYHLSEVSSLSTEPRSLMDLLRTLHSRAAIVSWYDDNEWLVAAPSVEFAPPPS